MPIHLLSRCLPLIRVASTALMLFSALAFSPVHAETERFYGATSTDEKFEKLYWALPETSSEEAQAAAVAECKRAGGKKCQALNWFADSCSTWARDTGGRLFPGYSASPEIAAKQAIRRCTAESPPGKCRLAMLPVCVGPGYSPEHNQAAAKATPAQLEALSAKLDQRGYWGAITETETGGLQYADDYPSEEGAVKALLDWEECKGCTKLLTYTDSCVGLAWEKGVKGRGTSFTLLNPDPVVARNEARSTCNTKRGTSNCVAMVRCSGRAYIDGYPGFDEKPN